MNAIRSLSIMPERFPFLTAEFIPLNKYHKMFVEKYYLILYQIKDQTVFVDYIVDCRQDYGWLVCKLNLVLIVDIVGRMLYVVKEME